MGLFSLGQQWGRKRALKRDWLLALRMLRGPGRGIDIPAHDPVAAVALQELLRSHPELTVQRFRDAVTLSYRRDVEAIACPETFNYLDKAGFFARADDDLVAAAEMRLVELETQGRKSEDE